MNTVEAATFALLPGVQIPDEGKPMAMHLASQYLNELRYMCEANEPLWIGANDGREILNVAEYYNGMFPLELQLNMTRAEASRGNTFVKMNSVALVDTFRNAVSFFFFIIEVMYKFSNVFDY